MSSIDKVSIKGTYPVTSTVAPSYTASDTSAFRVQFFKDINSANPFSSAKFGVILAEGIKIFVGVFTSDNGMDTTFIQIPLIGQSINDLVSKLNNYADVIAETTNSSNFISTDSINQTALGDGSNKWLYFEVPSIEVNSTYSTLNRDLRFFLTTPQPISAQNNILQSLGGFVSQSEIYSSALLASSLSVYDTTLYINPDSFSSSLSVNDLNKSPFLQINDEIVQVNRWEEFSVYLTQRNMFDTPLRYHPKNSVVRELAKNDFFDRNLSEDGEQYRCLAIKNTNLTEIAKDLKVFFKLPSRNNLSSMKLAIELPKSDYYSDTVTSGGFTAFTVTSLINKFPNDYFVTSPIVFTSGPNAGQVRIVKSYIANSGTIIVDSRLPNSVSTGNEFYIDTAPAQRIKSGTKVPTGLQFYDASNEASAVSINVSNTRISGNNLKPQETIYVWIKRSISETNDEFSNNRSMLSLIYSKV